LTVSEQSRAGGWCGPPSARSGDDEGADEEEVEPRTPGTAMQPVNGDAVLQLVTGKACDTSYPEVGG